MAAEPFRQSVENTGDFFPDFLFVQCRQVCLKCIV
jgi:hypothetical protein